MVEYISILQLGEVGFMDTALILIRHGESLANLKKSFAGSWNVNLTKKGLRQAKLTAEYIVKNYKVDKIYSSDLNRAFCTAKEVSILTGVEIVSNLSLREINAGQWEKKSFDELEKLFPISYGQTWKNDIGRAVCDGGESVEEVGERVFTFLEKIAKENEGKTLVVATHATPIRTALCKMANKPVICAKEIPWATNASVTVVKYSHGKWVMVVFSYDEHLQGESTCLPANV